MPGLTQGSEQGRLLPTDLTAEASVLGACMLDARMIGDVLLIIDKPSLFLRPAHGIIWETLTGMFDENTPIDIPLLKAALRKRGKLEKVGGVQYLEDLVNAVPSTAHAEYYARIVRDKAIQRGLIQVCDEFSNRAYEGREDGADLVDAAESAIMAIAERASTDRPKDISELGATFDALIEGFAVGSVETGFVALDEMLAGMHNGELLLLAARPSVGKTAWVLNVLDHAAVNCHVPTILFSLETSDQQILQRQICIRGQFDGHNLRRKRIPEQDFGRLAMIWGAIREAPIQIDDSPGMTIMQLRAKARRAKRERNIGLVIVDYVQLLGCPTRGRESRQVEVAAVGRGLKALARDLDVPVLAAAQLNRGPEHRANARPVMSDLRECVTGDTEVINADTGQPTRVDALQGGERILGVRDKHQIEADEVASVWKTSTKETLRLKTASGKTLCATANHPVLTDRGWVALGELRLDDTVASAARLPGYGPERPDREDLCRFLGYMAGNGTMQWCRAAGVIIPDAEAFEDCCDIVVQNWPEVTIRRKNNKYNDASFTRVYENGYGKPGGNPLLAWLEHLGVRGTRDYTKHVPAFVWESGRVGAAAFLSGYLATDGCVTKDSDGRWSVRFDTTSRRLARDVQLLLCRLGVACVIGNGYTSKMATRPIYRVAVAGGAVMVRRLAAQLTTRGYRGALLKEASAATVRDTGFSLMSLPRRVSKLAAEISAWRHQGKTISRVMCRRIAVKTGNKDLLAWADTNMLWEPIRSITPGPRQGVYDLILPNIHSFLANGIAVHNSGSLEQDADVVMLLHRNDYQKEADPNAPPPLTEVIVAKQRNGPTGKIDLMFRKPTGRFDPVVNQTEPWME